MKVLLTGALGFIGSNFAHKLLSKTQTNITKVIILDKLTYAGNSDNLKNINSDPRLQIIEGDILDYSHVSRILHEQQIDYAFNFAAESHVDRSIDSPESFFNTNVIGVVRLMDACRHYYKTLWGSKKDTFRIIQVSTDEVYGSLKNEDSPFTEKTPYAPNSPYAASKAGGDFVARSYAHTYGLPIITTNCSNNYGPFQFPEKLIPLLIIKALKEEPLTLYGDGMNIRDWLHVQDHCEALLQVASGGKVAENYNIGGNCEMTNLDVAKTICKTLEHYLKPKKVHRYEELITFVRDRPGHDKRYAVNCNKISYDLDWSPNYSFEEGIRETVSWYLNNSSWWQKILGSRYSGERLGQAA